MTDYTPFKKEMTYRMVIFYCLSNHGGEELCDDCKQFLKRSLKRLDECRYKDKGYSCPKCPHCCFESDRERTIQVVSYENSEPSNPEYASRIFYLRGIEDISEAEKEYDPRYNVKRDGLKKAFLKVIGTKPFAEIKVSEVCSAAGVSRSTFYTHYGTLMDLVDDCTFDASLLCDFLPSQAGYQKWNLPPAGEPLCIFLRKNPGYRAMFFDRDLTDHCVDLICDCSAPRVAHTLMGTSNVDISKIMGVCNTAVRGCIENIRRNLDKSDEEWAEIKKQTDTFYNGGLRVISLE